MKKSLLLLISISLLLIQISFASDSEGNLYKDPRGRYTIILPEKWTTMEDGRKDIFRGLKDKEEGYLTIMSFPPPEEKESMDIFFKKAIELLQPDKVLEKEEIEMAGLKGAVLDFKKEIQVTNYEINDESIAKMKEKIADKQLDRLEKLKDSKFTQEKLTETLTNMNFTVDEIQLIGNCSIKVESTGIFDRKTIYFLFRDKELLTFTLEASEENYSLFEEDFSLLKDSFQLTSDSFGGCLYIDPKGYYSLQLPYNWGIGPDTGKDVYFTGIYDKGIAFCDVTNMAKPVATSDINVVMDYWKKEIKNKITFTKTGLSVSGLDAAFVQYEYVQETGKAHVVDNYIFIKDSYLFIVSFDTPDDFSENFKDNFDFILSSLKIDI
ncbi:MAG TPA: hypothetical protein PL110_05690 [Candidatus Eremiobacteraeota bacterium]|nr:MAG: hypothetical protein BWY64_02848 [bacterium ADurb.Bin363]HPZ07585.1 hypothetical protein [Candidatus Eremiobacteraeota bacterium]